MDDQSDPNAADTRDRLLKEAARLFAGKGYGATSIREITRAAKTTNVMVYYHFGSKAGLHRAIVEDGVARFGEEVIAILQAPGVPLRARLERLFALYARALEERPHVARVVFWAFSNPDDEHLCADLMRDINARYEDALTCAIEEARDARELRGGSWRTLKLMIGGMLMYPVLRGLAGEGEGWERFTEEALVDLFMEGARQPIGADAAPTADS